MCCHALREFKWHCYAHSFMPQTCHASNNDDMILAFLVYGSLREGNSVTMPSRNSRPFSITLPLLLGQFPVVPLLGDCDWGKLCLLLVWLHNDRHSFSVLQFDL